MKLTFSLHSVRSIRSVKFLHRDDYASKCRRKHDVSKNVYITTGSAAYRRYFILSIFFPAKIPIFNKNELINLITNVPKGTVEELQKIQKNSYGKTHVLK